MKFSLIHQSRTQCVAIILVSIVVVFLKNAFLRKLKNFQTHIRTKWVEELFTASVIPLTDELSTTVGESFFVALLGNWYVLRKLFKGFALSRWSPHAAVGLVVANAAARVYDDVSTKDGAHKVYGGVIFTIMAFLAAIVVVTVRNVREEELLPTNVKPPRLVTILRCSLLCLSMFAFRCAALTFRRMLVPIFKNGELEMLHDGIGALLAEFATAVIVNRFNQKYRAALWFMTASPAMMGFYHVYGQESGYKQNLLLVGTAFAIKGSISLLREAASMNFNNSNLMSFGLLAVDTLGSLGVTFGSVLSEFLKVGSWWIIIVGIALALALTCPEEIIPIAPAPANPKAGEIPPEDNIAPALANPQAGEIPPEDNTAPAPANPQAREIPPEDNIAPTPANPQAGEIPPEDNIAPAPANPQAGEISPEDVVINPTPINPEPEQIPPEDVVIDPAPVNPEPEQIPPEHVMFLALLLLFSFRTI